MLMLYLRAEFPLQWLGECLIHQSMLYEGNPDSTNIRERFRYTFDMPVEPTEPQAESEASAQPAINGEKNATESVDTATQAAASVPVPAPDASMANGEKAEAQHQEASAHTDTQAPSASAPGQDVDMEGTS
jgi:hypothetical protein